MTTATETTAPAGHRAAADLAAIREQWGDLLAAIERPPAAEWPPRETRGFLDQGAAEADEIPAEPVIGRTPLTLRQHPAPLNLDALDAAMSVERALFAACDALAERVQRPVRRHLVGRPTPEATLMRWAEDTEDRDDPARWHLPTNRDAGPAAAASAGSRAHGLHWAAVWLEGRALSEPHGDLFTPTPATVLDDLAAVARLARRRIERALDRDARTTTLADPCPWCAGTLTARTRPGDDTAVTCSTGEGCGASIVLDHGRRTWRGADLVGLFTALDAARRGE